MKLIGRDKKLVLCCTYEERDFPKKLKGRWSLRNKAWTFEPSLMTYNIIIEKAASKGLELIVDKRVADFFKKKKENDQEYKITNTFKTEPRDYQKKSLSYTLSKQKAFIFGGVGVGKTKIIIDSITVLYHKGEVKRCLVVSPSSIMWNFENEVKIHSHLDCTILSGTLRKRKELIKNSQSHIDIINYEMIDKMRDDISNKKYDMIVFDEIHYCKNRKSIRSKASYDISRDIKIRVGMTGTAISNSYEDLFMLYKIIDETIFGPHFTKFKDRYFIIGGWGSSDEIIGYKNEEELKSLVSSNSLKFDIRDVVKDLPPEQTIIKIVHLNQKSRKIYKELKNNMLIEHERGDIVANNVLERLIRLSQITSGYLVDKENSITETINEDKIDVLKSILEGITEKVSIFCRFRNSIDRVVSLCEKMTLSYYVYDGRTKEKDLYLRFNKDDTKVWISQIQKSEGYSIPSAKYCIFYEMDYSRKNHVQAKGRILRSTGSPHDCIFYMYLIVKGTVDEAIYDSLKEKDFTSEQALEFVKGV